MVNRFYFNHIAIEAGATARALVTQNPGEADKCSVVTAAGWTHVCDLPLSAAQQGFRGSSISEVDLSSLPNGRYALKYEGETSAPFYVEKGALLRRTLSAVLNYFYDQRAIEPWNEQDRAVPFVGAREGSVDVHGGWYDASGDLSKYLSHLSYANFMNPQQTPLVVWGLLEHLEIRQGEHEAGVAERLKAEAAYGAEFLCRMQDPEGYFYMTVFDQWSKFPERRVICAFKTQKGDLLENYQAGYRQGGGLSIAALARSARLLNNSDYLKAAVRGFEHLEEHNLKYLDDGKENIIDDYCALLASIELWAASGEQRFLLSSRKRANSLCQRVRSDGKYPGSLRADDADRAFYHAAEAGLPALALMVAASHDPEQATVYLQAVEAMLRFELQVTQEVDNPFAYARQYVQDSHGQKRSSFFIPHENETGYWWQGENARLGSLAAAAARYASLSTDEALKAQLRLYAFSQMDWICGKNPFDSCMVHGFGRNNGNYMNEWPNVSGGICNGITAGFEDESDVDFGRDDVSGDQNWRWHEQWLPHATWFLIALGELSPSPSHDISKSASVR